MASPHSASQIRAEVLPRRTHTSAYLRCTIQVTYGSPLVYLLSATLPYNGRSFLSIQQ